MCFAGSGLLLQAGRATCQIVPLRTPNATTTFEPARESSSMVQAQDLVLTELEDTSRSVTDPTQSRHLNFHIHLSVAEAAAGTLCRPHMWFVRLRATRFQQHAVGGMGGLRQSRVGTTSRRCRRNRTEGPSHLPHTPLVPNATRKASLGRLNASIICMSSRRRCSPAQS